MRLVALLALMLPTAAFAHETSTGLAGVLHHFAPHHAGGMLLIVAVLAAGYLIVRKRRA